MTTSAWAQTEFFGEWEGPSVEYYVDLPPIGAPGNPGTLAAPVASITEALQTALMNGDLGIVPVTINVADNGPGTAYQPIAAGGFEVFPITIPAHGVTIEAYSVASPNGPLVTALPGGATETILIDDVGNAELPPSTIRGLELWNSFQVPNSAVIRIDGAMNEDGGRMAPEIRDCVITGEPEFGIQILSSPGIQMEPLIERCTVEPIDPLFGTAGVDIVGAGGMVSPMLRSNELQRFSTNVRITGGGLANQTRLQSNFIQTGNVNVELDDCAPFLQNNTIAFSQDPNAASLRWANMPALTLVNNLIWNPNVPDVAGPLAVFNSPDPVRFAWFNWDEDDTLFNATNAGVLGVISIFSVAAGAQGPPQLVGGDFNTGTGPFDLHLTAASPCIGAGFDSEIVDALNGALTTAVPGLGAPIDVRRDVAYDIDFEGRIQGFAQLLTTVDVGADEFTDILGDPATSGTRGATLQYAAAPAVGVATDVLGNLLPDATGTWLTEVEVVGTPGDFVALQAGFGFDDFVTVPALAENRSVYQNGILNPGFLPGVVTTTSIGIDLGPNSLAWASGVIPANGVFTAVVNLGGAAPALFESEIQIQAAVFDPTFTRVQSTARLTIEVNE